MCYLLRYSYDPYPYANKVIAWVKKKLKCKVIIIGPEVKSILKGYTVLPNCGPIEFLNLFFNASFIITSSFHGTSFAINFQKNFFTIIDDKKTLDNRQISLINMLDIPQSCVIKKNTLLKDLTMPNLDYSKLMKIGQKRNESRQFLENAIK